MNIRPGRLAVLAALMAIVFSGGIALLGAGAASAQSGLDGAGLGGSGAPVTAPHIIPRPNSGVAPQHPGDRGSGTQYLVLAGVVVAPLILLGLVMRESKRKRHALAERQSVREAEPAPGSARAR